ncbi:MAG: polysaccharide biosynthesis/export family protein [Litorimonas sp.]
MLDFRTLLVASTALAIAFALPVDADAQSRYGYQPPVQTQGPAPMSGRMMMPRQVVPHPASAFHPGAYARPVHPAYAQTRQTRFQQWMDWEAPYTLVPGDQLDIVVSSAPELSRTLTVGPDGRVVMPMSRPIMAAGRTFVQLQSALMAELGLQLRDPRISVTPRAYAPEQIFVGGQVGQPGTYTLASPIGALEAILMAGGLRTTAKGKEVVVLRRAPGGGVMMRTVNVKGGLKTLRRYDDLIQLRRGDIVFVPATGLAEVGNFVQNFRNALPVDFNIAYQFGQGGDNGTTVISP